MKTADAFTCLHSYFDVAMVSPVRTPRIFHKEVLQTVLGAIANDQSSMVNIVPAAQICNDTPCVLHKDYRIRLKSDGDWTFLYRTSQLFRVHWRDIYKSFDF